jgi:hypothetical protein
LANFTYQPIDQLMVRLPVIGEPKKVHSLENGPLTFQRKAPAPGNRAPGYPVEIEFRTRLGINDVILVE